MPSELTVGSLFAGIRIGGFDLGFHRAGLPCRWQVELDTEARGVLARHFPETARFADVRDCGAHNLAPVDIITGGFPCQDLSVAGARAGLAGNRSGLFFEIVRIVREMREATDGAFPGYVVLENVPGLLSSNGGRDFAVVLGELAQLGAVDIGWRVQDAQYWGVAQRRRRVFIVCRFGAGASTAEILSLSTSGSRHTPSRRKAGEGLARGAAVGFGGGGGIPDVAGPLMSHTSFRGDLDGHGAYIPSVTPLLEVGARTNGDGDRDGDGIGQPGDPMYTLQATKQHGVLAPIAFSSKDHGADATLNLSPTLRAANFDTSWANGGGPPAIAFHLTQDPISGDVAPSMSAGNQQGCATIGIAYALGSHAGSNGAASNNSHTKGGPVGFGIVEEGTPALRAGRQQTIAAAMAVRRLTPKEAERLQGFPDSWTAFDADGKPQSDSARYRQLGNAVCVAVAEWIGRRLVGAA